MNELENDDFVRRRLVAMEAEETLRSKMRREYESLPNQRDFIAPNNLCGRVVMTQQSGLEATLAYYKRAIPDLESFPIVVVTDIDTHIPPQVVDILAKFPDIATRVVGSSMAAQFVDRGCVAYYPDDGQPPRWKCRYALRELVRFAKDCGYASNDLDETICKITSFQEHRRWPRYFESNIGGLAYVYARLTDYESRHALLAMACFRSTQSLRVIPIANYQQYFHPLVMPTRGDIVYEGGIENGNSTNAFLQRVGSDGRIFAFEPMESFISPLKEKFRNNQNITLVNKGLWDEKGTAFLTPNGAASTVKKVCDENSIACDVCSIDEYEAENKTGCDFIKLDIEGAEVICLRGAMRTIHQYRPKLAISIYHNPKDLFEIPIMIAECGIPYYFYIGIHSVYGSEVILYGISKSELVA